MKTSLETREWLSGGRFALVATLALLWADATVRGAELMLTSDNAAPATGQTVTVRVGITNAGAFAVWGCCVAFDPARLQLVGQTNGIRATFVADSRGLGAMNASGEARMGGYAFENTVGNGVLCELRFMTLVEGATAVSAGAKTSSTSFGAVLTTVAGADTIPAVPGALMLTIGGAPPDNDLDGISDSEDPDDDNDGMPDAWETAKGFDPCYAPDGGQDADGDGLSNLQEYIAGTNPADAGSTFQVSCLRQASGGQVGFALEFQTVTGRTYGVIAESDPSGASVWSVVTNGIPGTGGYVEVIDPTVSARRFYRITVR